MVKLHVFILLLLSISAKAFTSNPSPQDSTSRYFFKVLDKRNKTPLPGAVIKIFDRADVLIDSVKTNDSGIAVSAVPRYTKVVASLRLADNDRYFTTTVTPLSLSDTLIITLEKIMMCPLTVTLKNLYFNCYETSVQPDDTAALNFLLKIWPDNPGMVLEIEAHADAGKEFFKSQQLSKRRAENVRAWLFKHGISSEKMQIKWWGCKHPVNKCEHGVECTDEQHRENRRVQFKVLKL